MILIVICTLCQHLSFQSQLGCGNSSCKYNIVLLRIFISFSLSSAIRKYCDFNVLNPEKDFHLKVLKSFKIRKVQHLVVLATKINVSMLVQDKVTFLLYICLKLFPQVAFVSIVVRGHPALHKPVTLRHI